MGKVKLELQNKQLRMPKIMTRFFSFRYKRRDIDCQCTISSHLVIQKKQHVSGQLEIRTK